MGSLQLGIWPLWRIIMPRTRKIVMTVFCLEEDADSVKESLFNENKISNIASCWFYGHDCPLNGITINVLEPTEDEDKLSSERFEC